MNLTKTRNTTKYLAIKELSDENKTYSISALCEFAGIARSAYYKWLGHVNSDNDNLNERIADTITKIHDEHPDMGYVLCRTIVPFENLISISFAEPYLTILAFIPFLIIFSVHNRSFFKVRLSCGIPGLPIAP